MNTSGILLCALSLLFVVQTTDVAGQFTDCHGQRVLCSRQTRYPYNVCENGQVNVHCFSYDDIPLPSNVMRTQIPLCFDEFLAMASAPDALYIQGTKIFDKNNLLQDLHTAVDEWNCICGFDAGSPGCCVKIIFSNEVGDFASPNRAAQAEYVHSGCATDCAHAVVKINISPEFISPPGIGTDVRSFYNGNYPPPPPSNNYALYSLTDVVQHELGHILGFDHYTVGGCQGAGIMDVVQPNVGRTGLSDDDRCRFAYLYCSTVVPVAEHPDREVPHLSVSPNPVNHTVSVQYALAAPARVTIHLVGIDGTLVRVLQASRQPSGVHQEAYDLSNLANGTYYITLQIENSPLATQPVLVHR